MTTACDEVALGDSRVTWRSPAPYRFREEVQCRCGSGLASQSCLSGSPRVVQGGPVVTVKFRDGCRASRRFPTDVLVPNAKENRVNVGRASREHVFG